VAYQVKCEITIALKIKDFCELPRRDKNRRENVAKEPSEVIFVIFLWQKNQN
jgi:hypothetical protein